MAIEINYDDVIGMVSLIGQLIAVWMAYRIYRHNRVNKGWLAIVAALGVMLLRRFTSLALLLGLGGADYTETLRLWDRSLIPLIVTVLLLIGIWSMKKSFDSFAVVERQTIDKVGSLLMSKKR